MVKAFCLLCTRFKHSQWRFGWCTIREKNVHNPLINCTTFYEAPNAKYDPKAILQWYKNAIALNQQRLGMIEAYMKIKGYLKENEKA